MGGSRNHSCAPLFWLCLGPVRRFAISASPPDPDRIVHRRLRHFLFARVDLARPFFRRCPADQETHLSLHLDRRNYSPIFYPYLDRHFRLPTTSHRARPEQCCVVGKTPIPQSYFHSAKHPAN